jgi:hypothetical protein
MFADCPGRHDSLQDSEYTFAFISDYVFTSHNRSFLAFQDVPCPYTELLVSLDQKSSLFPPAFADCFFSRLFEEVHSAAEDWDLPDVVRPLGHQSLWIHKIRERKDRKKSQRDAMSKKKGQHSESLERPSKMWSQIEPEKEVS